VGSCWPDLVSVLLQGELPLVKVVWPSEAVNPLQPMARASVRYGAAVGSGASFARLGAAAVPLAELSRAAVAESSLSLSVVNLQERPLFVFAGVSTATDSTLRALTPWTDAQGEDERPVALTQPGPSRGANCLLLAPYEGLPSCVEEDAETEAFGESNTFRYEAASGEALSLDSVSSVRVEVAFQAGNDADAPEAETMAALLGGAYEEPAPDVPFCSLTLRLRLQGGK